MQRNPYPLRIDDEVMEKIRVVANENGRSVNREIEYVLKQHVKDYEEKNGVIVLQSE